MRLLLCAAFVAALSPAHADADVPSRREATDALAKAVTFFHQHVGVGGGYVWRSSGDLALREGEGQAGKTLIWVQPPGTPTVGEAMLDAYEATGDRRHLGAALDAARALVRGQLRTGGWYYHIELDPEKRRGYGYRDVPEGLKQQTKSTLDDDTTQAAVRFLVRIDKALGLKEAMVHEATVFALDSIVRAQFPNGGWYQWWDRDPEPADPRQFPVIPASYPDSWPRTWPNDWTGRYFINDNVVGNTIAAMLDAHDAYGDARHLACAEKAGEFLLLAQMPEPQPAWAQQYDPKMHPVWDRRFEPPAISGYESQGVLQTLMLLFRKTGNRKYLKPIPRAIAYLRESALPDGRLARFYELKTNRPLYFKRTGRRYDLTYSAHDLPSHYGFRIESRLDAIEAEYRRLCRLSAEDLTALKPREPPRNTRDLAPKVRRIIDAMDERGAWIERGIMRDGDGRKVEPASGVIASRTFIENMHTLCGYVRILRTPSASPMR